MRETIVMFGSEADSYDRSADQLRVCGGGAGLTLIYHTDRCSSTKLVSRGNVNCLAWSARTFAV